MSNRLRVVYVAHPLASDPPANKERAFAICRKLSETMPGVVPVSPLVSFSFLREPDDRELAMAFCQALLCRCDEFWLTGRWWESKGCLEERTLAEKLGLPIVAMGGASDVLLK